MNKWCNSNYFAWEVWKSSSIHWFTTNPGIRISDDDRLLMGPRLDPTWELSGPLWTLQWTHAPCYLGDNMLSSFMVSHSILPRNETLTHWGQVMHTCISKLTIIGSDNGLSPGPCQAIIWTNAGILLIWPSATNFNEMLIKIAKWQTFCLGLNVLMIFFLS